MRAQKGAEEEEEPKEARNQNAVPAALPRDDCGAATGRARDQNQEWFDVGVG